MRAFVALPVVALGCWVAFVGCDDDRPVVDAGAGGQPEGGQATAGESTTDGGTESLGGGAAGGVNAGGQGGTSGTPECPTDIFSAQGEDCSAFGEGFLCSDGADDPCQFGQSIICRFGTWERQEAFPAPCGGAGGGGNAGGAGGDLSGAGVGGN